MSDPTREALQRAYALLKAGRRTETLHIVQQIIMSDEANVDAWWLMANAIESQTDRRVALAHVLDLNPRHGKARKMLVELVARNPKLAEKPDLLAMPARDAAPTSAQPKSAWRRRLLFGLVVFLLLFVTGVLLIGGGVLSLPGAFVLFMQ